MTDAIDPLLLGQRVVAILETGVRVVTYKLATLMALIDQCIENLPEHPADSLTVPIPDLAHRVMESYWRQVRPFEASCYDSPAANASEFLGLSEPYALHRPRHP